MGDGAPQASPYVDQALRPTPLLPLPQDAANLAQKLVSSYGLSDVGITTYAPPGEPPGFGRKAFEVAIDNIDVDLFGRSAQVRSRFEDSKELQIFLVHTYSMHFVTISTWTALGTAPRCGVSVWFSVLVFWLIRKNFEVALDNIDVDLIGRSAQVRCFLFCFSILSYSTWLYSSVLAGACCGACLCFTGYACIASGAGYWVWKLRTAACHSRQSPS